MTTINLQDIEARLNQLCKPPGSLGAIETLAARLCRVQNTLTPSTSPRRIVIFAADHGVTAEGVSAWPSEVTGLVTRVMANRRTASGVFANQLNCQYEVVDIGLLQPLSVDQSRGTLMNAAKRRSTANLRLESAMTADDFDHAWSVGVSRADAAADAGCKLVIGGEMGIGNTTSASCLVSLLTNTDVGFVVGRGAGINDAGLLKKTAVVQDAVKRVHDLGEVDARRIGCEVGGLEIVALAGFYAQSADRSLTIFLDGFIATAAALLAQGIHRRVVDGMIATHRSTEPGHTTALAKLGLTPIVDLGLRLGEGTGALAAVPLADLAAAMINDMATLDQLQ